MAERLEELQESGGRTTASLYSQARIVPEWSEGEMVGVRLNQVKPGSLYEKLGIESGDVITSLNGISIDSPQASSRLLTEFTQAEEFTIELQDGQVIEVDAGQLSQILGDEG
jgi:general secretion pathway protein C